MEYFSDSDFLTHYAFFSCGLFLGDLFCSIVYNKWLVFWPWSTANCQVTKSKNESTWNMNIKDENTLITTCILRRFLGQIRFFFSFSNSFHFFKFLGFRYSRKVPRPFLLKMFCREVINAFESLICVWSLKIISESVQLFF